MFKLLPDLEAQFLRHEVRIEPRLRRQPDGSDKEEIGPHEYFHEVDTLAEAQGVEFLCPVCFAKNNGNVGTHHVICWFRGKVPDNAVPGPGRWDASGSGLHNLTLNPSVNLDVHDAEFYKKYPACCRWHGWVKEGVAT